MIAVVVFCVLPTVQGWLCYLQPKVDGFTPKPCSVQCLLPHEILDALSDHPFAFRSLMTGSMDPTAIEAFWKHCATLSPWCQHPVFEENEDIPLDRTIPLCIHGDGAQFFRDDEMFTYSISSLFADSGVVEDVLLHKFPFLIIPERFMKSEVVSERNLE